MVLLKSILDLVRARGATTVKSSGEGQGRWNVHIMPLNVKMQLVPKNSALNVVVHIQEKWKYVIAAGRTEFVF